ncbi:MAG: glycosyltransferase family 39 protein [Clostridia bacterium]|nr:glycosyltransferase family 39 protein [Clostridia bacterium]
MRTAKKSSLALIMILTVALVLRLALIFKYGNLLTLDSDDLNYIKSAVYLLRSGLLTYQSYHEPTVYIMPGYPAFLALIFKIFGSESDGIQAIRIIQAIISTATILIVYLMAKRLFNSPAAILSAAFLAIYPPNMTTAGFLMTETIFTFLLCLLIYSSILCVSEPSVKKFVFLGAFLAVVTLFRPTIAMYPALLFIYLLISHRMKVGMLIKQGAVMILSFCIIMSPWWIRNYIEYATFIPLSASSGNPMLQGTYIHYRQTPDNITYYKLGKDAFETDQNEVETAKKRIKEGFKKDFWSYLQWYTIGKTRYYWGTIFYWKEFAGISQYHVLALHYMILSGFFGMGILILTNYKEHLLPILTILYFNAVHCVYMAFDRYAFPVIPVMTMYSAYFMIYVHKTLLISNGRIEYKPG